VPVLGEGTLIVDRLIVLMIYTHILKADEVLPSSLKATYVVAINLADHNTTTKFEIVQLISAVVIRIVKTKKKLRESRKCRKKSEVLVYMYILKKTDLILLTMFPPSKSYQHHLTTLLRRN